MLIFPKINYIVLFKDECKIHIIKINYIKILLKNAKKLTIKKLYNNIILIQLNNKNMLFIKLLINLKLIKIYINLDNKKLLFTYKLKFI